MSQETKEDLSIVTAIAALERGADPSVAKGPPQGDETAETLVRLYTEVLGLIPAELAPVPPSAGARDRLLAAIGAAPAVAPSAPPAPSPPPAASKELSAPAAPPVPTAISEALRPAPRIAPGPIPRRQSRWPLALAAVLALAFAGTSVWLWLIQQEQSADIARLRQELAAQRQLASTRARDAEEGRQARTEMDNMRARFALVTSPDVEVFPLRPVGDQASARGMLFVAPDHQHWYLTLDELPPPAEGGVYKLWWMTPRGPLDAGSLAAQQEIRMSSDEMPAGTTGVVVTLEPTPGSTRPTGPEILRTGP